jgi:hypothetical protein
MAVVVEGIMSAWLSGEAGAGCAGVRDGGAARAMFRGVGVILQ